MARLPFSKSTLTVAQEALKSAEHILPLYAHRFAPKKFTQPQLFAILTIRHFFHLDYRSVVQLLREWSDLRELLGLKIIPDYSTLCRAEARLLKNSPSNNCLTPSCVQPASAT